VAWQPALARDAQCRLLTWDWTWVTDAAGQEHYTHERTKAIITSSLHSLASLFDADAAQPRSGPASADGQLDQPRPRLQQREA
jgi:hypothetical protein